MERIFGFDIGTTSIGFAVIDHDPDAENGQVLRLGVRVFPEARDEKGTPLNQQRRQKRMMRRQTRRRRVRRRMLNELLSGAGLLPVFGSPAWAAVMGGEEPYELRRAALSEPLTAHQLGRVLYHLAQRRHFRGRDLEEDDDGDSGLESKGAADSGADPADEKEARSNRASTLQALKETGQTLGAWLADRQAAATKGRPPQERRRAIHAHRAVVEAEFAAVWAAQQPFHACLRGPEFRAQVEDAIFAQRPVFWRRNTLGRCRFLPGEALCPKGSWLSQQRRMLEKLNNLTLAGGNQRPLDEEERAAILVRLQSQASMSWDGVRKALKPLFKARGEAGMEKTLRFNLQASEDKLLGNAVEGKLAAIFGADWSGHPHRAAIRDAIHTRLWAADYGEIGVHQRVVIRAPAERERLRAEAAQSFIGDFGVTATQADALGKLTLPTGWEPYSATALQAFLPHLEAGHRFGALVTGPEWEAWRDHTFPNRERPTGEVFDRLPSPAEGAESKRIAALRNPTVVRTQNELRKVVNNLIALFGKPDRIRVEVAREVGKSKRERQEILDANRDQDRQRQRAAKDLISKGIADPSRQDVERWLLWKESKERCPYTGDQIGFDALFREGRYEVEHIWPRSLSFDDSFRNKTLCRKEVNLEKGNRTPFQAFAGDEGRWAAIKERLNGMMAAKSGQGMAPGKVKRFLAESIPEDFASRQLNDTGYAARQAVAFLKRLWPDLGPAAPVRVEAVTGRVTAQLRKLWGLNNILGTDGEKTRADHRHHAIDALTVSATHPGMTNRLSRYWQDKDDPRAERPHLPPPWPLIRADAERAIEAIVVSHKVRKKVSGPLHKETVYGDTGQDVVTRNGTYRQFVTRKKVEALSAKELKNDPVFDGEGIRDAVIRRILVDWVAARGGDPKKAFPPYPTVGAGGPSIRKVRLLTKQQITLMARVTTGYADCGANHHIAIFRHPDGKAAYAVVSLIEAARRLAQREPLIQRTRPDGATFVMSLSPGDALLFPTGERKGVWIVTGAWASGQVVLERHNDADHATITRPTPGSLLREGAGKVAVDPIGRIRKAND